MVETALNKMKETEIGVIPIDWELKSYGEIFDFLPTATYSRADLSIDGEVKYIHYGDIHTKFNVFIDLDDGPLPTINSRQSKSYQLLQNGDVIVTDASEDYIGVGKSIEIRNKKSKGIAGLHTFLLRDVNQTFVDGFRGYIQLSSLVKKQFDRLATGMKVYGVSRNNLKTILIPVPPKAEQNAIATALSDADALITSLEKLIAKKRLVKQGLMQELFTPKQSWREITLGECAEIIGGGTPSTHVSNFWNGDINWFTPTEVGYQKYLYSSNRKISNLGLKNSSARLLPKGAILLTTRAGIGEIGILKEEGCTNQGFQSFVPKSSYSGEFIYYLLSTLTRVLVDNASGSTFLEISPGKLKQISVQAPELSEQEKIAEILSDCDAEINLLEKKLMKQRLLKQGMMQNLLTGKIRLV